LVVEIARLFPDVNLRWFLLEEGEMFVNEDSASEQIIDELQKENSKLKDKIIELLEK